MQNVLLITTSSQGELSHSNRIARHLVEKLAAARATTLTVRDLALHPLPHIEQPFVTGRMLPQDKRSERETAALRDSDTVIAELKAADVIVIAAPMHNFGVPSTLKAWIDHIARPGLTFSYSERGPEGLLKGKKAILVLATGGIYSSGPMKALDFEEPYLRGVLGFLGITDIDVVRVEGVAMGPEAVLQAIAKATAQADEAALKVA